MAVNHRYLIGKEIEYNHSDYIGPPSRAIVVHIDKDVGITIVDKDDKKRNLICLNGPSTTEYKKHGIKKKNYEKCFKKIAEGINNGSYTYSRDQSDMYYGQVCHYIGQSPCPYTGE